MITAKRPTIAELETILNQEGNSKVEFLPNGEITVNGETKFEGYARYNAVQEAYIDHSYAVRRKNYYTGKYKRGWLHCLLVRMFPKHFRGFACTLLSHANERSLINDYSFHEMMAMAERMAEPKITDLHVPGGHQ